LIHLNSPILCQNDCKINALGPDSLRCSIKGAKPEVLSFDFADKSYELKGQWVDDIFFPHDKELLSKLLDQIRKGQHVDLCESEAVEAGLKEHPLDKYRFKPVALSSVHLKDVDTTCTFLGRTFNYPMLITGMTGGFAKGQMINQRLAQTAQKFNIPMGVGSQKLALKDKDYAKIFTIKQNYPDVFLIANIGIADLTYDSACGVVEMIQADALAIHLNVLQEWIQIEGERSFSATAETINDIASRLKVPVIVKEVGMGMDLKTAKSLHKIAAIDVGGMGGTSWALIEGLRAADPWTRKLGEDFRNFGRSTPECLEELRTQVHQPLIATGGIRSGLHVAKCLGLGATMCGIGLPLLQAALKDESDACLKYFVDGLKITMSLCEAQSILDSSLSL
jgi:isopentenyl-diphosphate Delta-isomerase